MQAQMIYFMVINKIMHMYVYIANLTKLYHTARI